MAVTQRKFGVEIEHGNRGKSHTDVLTALRRRGYPTTVNRRVGVFRPPTCYTSTFDGSGVEIRTPALKGLKGLEELQEVMADLTDLGGYTTGADGMHVHHQARDYYNQWDKIQELANTWIDNRGLIAKFVARHRCADSFVCAAIDKPRIHRGVAAKQYHFPRGDLNLGALHRHGTIEIRLHEGTLDPEKAVAWVVFGQAFIGTVSRYGGFKRQNSRADLLDHLGIADRYTETLLKAGK